MNIKIEIECKNEIEKLIAIPLCEAIKQTFTVNSFKEKVKLFTIDKFETEILEIKEKKEI